MPLRTKKRSLTGSAFSFKQRLAALIVALRIVVLVVGLTWPLLIALSRLAGLAALALRLALTALTTLLLAGVGTLVVAVGVVSTLLVLLALLAALAFVVRHV